MRLLGWKQWYNKIDGKIYDTIKWFEINIICVYYGTTRCLGLKTMIQLNDKFFYGGIYRMSDYMVL